MKTFRVVKLVEMKIFVAALALQRKNGIFAKLLLPWLPKSANSFQIPSFFPS